MPTDLSPTIYKISRSSAISLRAEIGLLALANSNPLVKNLLSRNEELLDENNLLTITLARLTAEAATPMACLTPRQQQVMARVMAGHPSKNIAADLNISQRTVENRRAAIMRRTGASSLPALVRMSMGVA